MPQRVGVRKCKPKNVVEYPSGVRRCKKYKLLCGRPKCGTQRNVSNTWLNYVELFQYENPEFKNVPRGELLAAASPSYRELKADGNLEIYLNSRYREFKRDLANKQLKKEKKENKKMKTTKSPKVTFEPKKKVLLKKQSIPLKKQPLIIEQRKNQPIIIAQSMDQPVIIEQPFKKNPILIEPVNKRTKYKATRRKPIVIEKLPNRRPKYKATRRKPK